MKNNLRIGMAGLDTSHVPAFASLLHDSKNEFHVPGGRIVAAFAGGSSDFSTSIDRVEGFTSGLRDDHGVEIVTALGDLRDKCDAVMLESIDGRVHLEQFRQVAEWGVPVFIDKPMTVSGAEAREIARIAEATGVRVTSASALRFAESFQQPLGANDEPITGADFFGPMAILEKCPGYFWYGIHSAEMLFEAMGPGCREVLATREGVHDIVVGRWSDGRLGTLRGNRIGSTTFGGTLHRKSPSISFHVAQDGKPYYASLLERVIPFFQGTSEVVPVAEAVEVISFLEAANQSVTSGTWISL